MTDIRPLLFAISISAFSNLGVFIAYRDVGLPVNFSLMIAGILTASIGYYIAVREVRTEYE